MTNADPYVLRAWVLVTDNATDLDYHLGLAFEDVDDVLQFTVEGYGWEPGDPEPTKETLLDALARNTAAKLRAEE